MKVRTLGIDLAKSVFSMHGVDERGKTTLHRALRRRQLLSFMAQLPPSLVGLEACGSAHYWAREITRCGHEVRLMSPRLVRPYVKSNKNDSIDAEAICEAVSRSLDAFRRDQEPRSAGHDGFAPRTVAADS